MTASATSHSTPAINDRHSSDPLALFRVKNSAIHGRGVFACRKIRTGTLILEYLGERISYEQACEEAAARDDESNHTFLFSLEDGNVIEGGRNGNDARWINHCCEPNCEAREEEGRIFIYALRDISRGEELNYDYGLVLDARYTPALKRAFACHCGKPTCRQTMLAPKRRR
jgi:SET domain-containing protein